jgi:putative ABC transport system permease protein
MTGAGEAGAPRGSKSRGGLPAARAVGRWAWRLFRKEWRQQLLVLALVTVAVATTVFGLLLAANSPAGGDARFGDADYLITLPGTDPTLTSDIATIKQRYGTIEVVPHESVALPGSVTAIDVRAEDPQGIYTASTLRLDSGRYPAASNEIAVTSSVLTEFGLSVGGTWAEGGVTWSVVGIVENPLNLLDDFAVIAPDAATSPTTVTVLAAASPGSHAGGLNISGSTFEVRQGDHGATAEATVLILAAIGLLFVGLIAVAGFAVMAQRRLRSLGLLGAMGATPRNMRLAFIANGAFVGAASAIAGAVLSLAAWMALAGGLEHVLQHRIDRANVPWLAVVAAMVLATVTSIIGSWWPARAATRTPVVRALASRPAPPKGAHRLAIPGALAFAAGLLLVVLGGTSKPALAALGILLAAAGVLLVAPLGPSLLARGSGRAPVAVRVALRDLARYRGRSGAAAAAVSLSVGIAVAIVVSLSAAQQAANASAGGGNLPDNQIAVWLSSQGRISPVPDVTDAQAQAASDIVGALANTLGATASAPLEAAVSAAGFSTVGGVSVGGPGVASHDPAQLGIAIPVTHNGEAGVEYRGEDSVTLYVATPELLRYLGLASTGIGPGVDVLTSHASFAGYDLIPYDHGGTWVPVVQHADLPTHTSDPTTLITQHAMDTLGLVGVPMGWIIQLDHTVTSAERAQARTVAAAAGLSTETRPVQSDLDRLRLEIILGGLALAIAVLAMTAGLIRSETASDLSTLAATGASSGIRRTLTAATAGALAVVGGTLGTAGAYGVLLVWHRHDLSLLTPIPWLDLALTVVGLPVAAWIVGWLVSGREPDSMARRRLE